MRSAATNRSEWFIFNLLRKLTRADLEDCLTDARQSSGACGDSYCKNIVESLIGDWNLERHIEQQLAARHSDLLKSLEKAEERADSLANEMRAIGRLARDLREVADKLEPPAKGD